MNWRLIFMTSLLGLVMAVATISWIPENVELPFWIVLLLVSAWVVARYASGNYFWTGFLISIVNSVWITAAHVLFYSTYIVNHPMMADMGAKMPLHNHPRIGMIVTGPVVGIIFGIVLGFLSWIASKIIKKTPADTSPAAE
jgi:hypothetical protein